MFEDESLNYQDQLIQVECVTDIDKNKIKEYQLRIFQLDYLEHSNSKSYIQYITLSKKTRFIIKF